MGEGMWVLSRWFIACVWPVVCRVQKEFCLAGSLRVCAQLCVMCRKSSVSLVHCVCLTSCVSCAEGVLSRWFIACVWPVVCHVQKEFCLVGSLHDALCVSDQLCVILEPMQELMSRHKAYGLNPRDCLKTTLFQKWQRMVAPVGKGRGASSQHECNAPYYMRTHACTHTHACTQARAHVHAHRHMHMCTCTHMQAHRHLCMCTHLNTHMRTHVHIHMYTHAHTCKHTHTCKYIHIHVHTYAGTRAWAHMYTYTFICTYVYTCTHMYTHAHTCKHTHTHSHTFVSKQVHTHTFYLSLPVVK